MERSEGQARNPTSAASSPGGQAPVLVAVDVRSASDGVEAAGRIAASLRRDLPGHETQVRPAGWREGGPGLLEAGDAPPRGAVPLSLVRGGIAGKDSVLLAVLRECERRGAAAVALVAGEPHEGGSSWLERLLAPILEEGFDYSCPTYGRHALDGALNTGVVYPLTRALYGQRLRQPLGGEAALSRSFAKRLLADTDWQRDPAAAGSDAWLVAKALGGRARTCQAWLGSPPPPGADHQDASHVVERVLGMVFREMERHAERWQHVLGSEPIPERGVPSAPAGPPPRPNLERLVSTFQLGQRELAPIWSAVLPPAVLLALRRAAAAPAESLRIDDGVWARVVYDFAVAHFGRLVERGQLLRSMTPLYLGWVASFANRTRELDPAAIEKQVEALCQAFEAEKRYLMARWRWPDAFLP